MSQTYHLLAIGLLLVFTSCQDHTPHQENTKPKSTLVQEGSSDQNEEQKRQENRRKIQSVVENYCTKLNNQKFKAAIKDNFSPEIIQYISMKHTTAEQVATEVHRFLSKKQMVNYSVDLDQLKIINGYRAEVPLSFSWLGYSAKVLLKLLFDKNGKIKLYQEAKILQQSALQFETKKYSKKQKGCRYDVSYVVITKAPAGLKPILNKKMKHYLNIENGQTLEQLSTEFMKSYDQYGKNRTGYWSSITRIYVSESNKFITFDYQHNEYSGGAHWHSEMDISLYDKKNGNKIELLDLFIDEAVSELKSVATKAFRKAASIPEDKSIHEMGFSMNDNDGFRFSECFKISEEGIIFIYKSYEGAHNYNSAPGFEIKYSQIRHLIRPDGLIGDKR